MSHPFSEISRNTLNNQQNQKVGCQQRHGIPQPLGQKLINQHGNSSHNMKFVLSKPARGAIGAASSQTSLPTSHYDHKIQVYTKANIHNEPQLKPCQPPSSHLAAPNPKARNTMEAK